MDCGTPGLSVPHHLLEIAQVHVHCISEAVQHQIESVVLPSSVLYSVQDFSD